MDTPDGSSRRTIEESKNDLLVEAGESGGSTGDLFVEADESRASAVGMQRRHAIGVYQGAWATPLCSVDAIRKLPA